MAAGLRAPCNGTSRCSAKYQRPARWKAPRWATARAWINAGGDLTTYNATKPRSIQAHGPRHHQRDHAHPADVADHFRNRGQRGLQEALCEFPGQRHGGPEPAAVSAVQRHRHAVGATGESWYNAFQAKLTKRYSQRPDLHRKLLLLEDSGQLRRQRQRLQPRGLQGPLDPGPAADPERQRQLHHAGLRLH